MTFRRVSAKQAPPPLNEKYIASGEVVLSATINDLELWDQVVSQLECMRIYTVKNLAEQMVSVAQRKAKEAEKQLEKASVAAEGELEVLRQKVSFLEHENKQLRDANQQWAQWASQQGVIPKPANGE